MKHWYQSKTMWLAIAQAIVAIIASYLSKNPTVEVAGYLLMIKSGLDLFLRMNTSTKIM